MKEQIPNDLPTETVVDLQDEASGHVVSKRKFLRFLGLGAATLPFAYSFTIVDASAAPESLGTVDKAENLEEHPGMHVYDLGKPVNFEGQTWTPLYGKGGGIIMLPVDRIEADRDATATGIQQNLMFEGFDVDVPVGKGGYKNIATIPFVIDPKDGKLYKLPVDERDVPYIIHEGRRFRVLGYIGILKKVSNVTRE